MAPPARSPPSFLSQRNPGLPIGLVVRKHVKRTTPGYCSNFTCHLLLQHRRSPTGSPQAARDSNLSLPIMWSQGKYPIMSILTVGWPWLPSRCHGQSPLPVWAESGGTSKGNVVWVGEEVGSQVVDRSRIRWDRADAACSPAPALGPQPEPNREKQGRPPWECDGNGGFGKGVFC